MVGTVSHLPADGSMSTVSFTLDNDNPVINTGPPETQDVHQYTYYTSPQLTAGEHTFEVQTLDVSANNLFWFDYLEYLPSGASGNTEAEISSSVSTGIWPLPSTPATISYTGPRSAALSFPLVDSPSATASATDSLLSWTGSKSTITLGEITMPSARSTSLIGPPGSSNVSSAALSSGISESSSAETSPVPKAISNLRTIVPAMVVPTVVVAVLVIGLILCRTRRTLKAMKRAEWSHEPGDSTDDPGTSPDHRYLRKADHHRSADPLRVTASTQQQLMAQASRDAMYPEPSVLNRPSATTGPMETSSNYVLRDGDVVVKSSGAQETSEISLANPIQIYGSEAHTLDHNESCGPRNIRAVGIVLPQAIQHEDGGIRLDSGPLVPRGLEELPPRYAVY